MKKIVLIVALVIALTALPVCAAEWKEGLGPQQPYAGVPEVDLSETMGYIMLYPRTKMPAEHFCDVLDIYLPREDIERGSGTLRLYDENGLVYSADFADEKQVVIRSLTNTEMEGLMWGGGTCVSVQLSSSLEIGKSYYVLMDEGCFTASGGQVTSLAITSEGAWVPVVTGEFGISNLSYRKGEAVESGVEAVAAQGTEEASAEEGKTANDSPLEVTLTPTKGDHVIFDLLLGGDAVAAVVYSENGSVSFDELEYSDSTTVEGTITGADISWGIVFLNADGDVLDVLSADK